MTIVSKLEVEALPLKDAFIIRPLRFDDERGIFFKLYTKEILARFGVSPFFNEEYLSISKKNVLRGLHFQKGEFSQAKLVRCTRGEVYDVIVDLRKSSPTFLKWHGVTLSEENGISLYVPRGFAHSFLALQDNSAVFYKADNNYNPESESGIIWNDPNLNIDWNITNPILSDKDKSWKTIKEIEIFE